jgi:thiamine pyrophosphokinase
MSEKTKKTIIFVNGLLDHPDALPLAFNEDDLIIAADGGLRYIKALNLQPDLILGDLDSANPNDVAAYEKQGSQVEKYPPEKDETDLELALNKAVALGFKRIRIVAALGGRLDQTLANIFLLTQPQLAGLDVRLIDSQQEVLIIRQAITLRGHQGDRVSLLPLQGPVHGIQTDGLTYPLKDETLYPDKSRGISNQFIKNQAAISIRSGLLLCIHPFQVSNERN